MIGGNSLLQVDTKTLSLVKQKKKIKKNPNPITNNPLRDVESDERITSEKQKQNKNKSDLSNGYRWPVKFSKSGRHKGIYIIINVLKINTKLTSS